MLATDACVSCPFMFGKYINFWWSMVKRAERFKTDQIWNTYHIIRLRCPLKVWYLFQWIVSRNSCGSFLIPVFDRCFFPWSYGDVRLIYITKKYTNVRLPFKFRQFQMRCGRKCVVVYRKVGCRNPVTVNGNLLSMHYFYLNQCSKANHINFPRKRRF